MLSWPLDAFFFTSAYQRVICVSVGPISLWCVMLTLCCSVISWHERLGFESSVQSGIIVLRCVLLHLVPASTMKIYYG